MLRLKSYLTSFNAKLSEEEEMFPDFYEPSQKVMRSVNDQHKNASERLKLMA